MQFAHVETGQTPEERVAVIQATTHQGISYQDSHLISQVLSKPPGITNLNDAGLTNIADMVSKGDISIKPDTKVLYNKGPQWQSGNTLTSHLCGRGSIPVMALSGKAGSCLPLVGSLQYRTLANCMYWFPLPFQLPVMI